MNWLSGQPDQRCGGESRSYRGRVAHVLTTMPRSAIAPVLPVTGSTAGVAKLEKGFDRAWESPG